MDPWACPGPLGCLAPWVSLARACQEIAGSVGIPVHKACQESVGISVRKVRQGSVGQREWTAGMVCKEIAASLDFLVLQGCVVLLERRVRWAPLGHKGFRAVWALWA